MGYQQSVDEHVPVHVEDGDGVVLLELGVVEGLELEQNELVFFCFSKTPF
jgi:hypothetical protein